jgi:hypothetical protein
VTDVQQFAFAVDCYDNADCEIYEGGCPECSPTPSGYCGYEFDGQPFQNFTVEVEEEGFEHFAGYEPQVCFYYRACKKVTGQCLEDERLGLCQQDTSATTFYFPSYSNIIYWDECDN